MKLDVCIVWSAYNTVFSRKRSAIFATVKLSYKVSKVKVTRDKKNCWVIPIPIRCTQQAATDDTVGFMTSQ